MLYVSLAAVGGLLLLLGLLGGLLKERTPVSEPLIAVVLGWTVLGAGLLLISGPPVLILVTLAAAAATVFDVMEVLRQLALANTAVAILAALVTLSHAAITVLAVLVLRRHGTSWRQGSEVA
jgi:hypothetical protein